MKNKKYFEKEALDYHEFPIPGKLEIQPTKPYHHQQDLALAYSPGVAYPCLAIQKEKETAYRYTNKGNLVAVISNGTAVLGLGDIGALASKPVMEGKGLLFKIFSGIDVYDIEIDEKNPEKFVEIVKSLAPTFGGINLEDIKSPEAFYIEERLKDELDIPVMHDDQHGTAIISGAALLNAIEVVGKKIEKIKIVVNGAGASAISCAEMYLILGIKPQNLVMLDSQGVISKEREADLSPQKKKFITSRKIKTLSEALQKADVFVGLSKAGVLSPDLLKNMAPKPVVFALANPEPEIDYNLAMRTRKDLLMATGRSDYPNQVNNVLGFPFIFRGALDVRAVKINIEMKLAAVRAIANLAKEPVPQEVNNIYNMQNMHFGPEYIIPKPFDPRLITRVSMAVAKAAMESGVARESIKNWNHYQEHLEGLVAPNNQFTKVLQNKTQNLPRKYKIVFCEADTYEILKAVEICLSEQLISPILLGRREKILEIIEKNRLDISPEQYQLYDPKSDEDFEKKEIYARSYHEKSYNYGITLYEAQSAMRERNYFGCMMLSFGHADGLITGHTRSYARCIRPVLDVIGPKLKQQKMAGMMTLVTKHGPIFLADMALQEDPSAEDIASITLQAAEKIRLYGVKPRVALLSYSSKGSSSRESPKKMKKALTLLHEKSPDLVVDGEFQADVVFNISRLEEMYPFSPLKGGKANLLIFPNLDAANIAYRLLLANLNELEMVGPILLGCRKPVSVLQMHAKVREIVNMVRVTLTDILAQKG